MSARIGRREIYPAQPKQETPTQTRSAPGTVTCKDAAPAPAPHGNIVIC
jgi:hypothetical protein